MRNAYLAPSEIPPLLLADEERVKLQLMAGRPTESNQRTAQRSRIVLDCAAGLSNTAVATRHKVTVQTVGKWRRRFLDGRLGGLGRCAPLRTASKLTDAKVEEVITRTLETRPKQATHWSTRTMAEASGLNQNKCASGGPSGSSRTCKKTSNSPAILSLWRRCATSAGLNLNPPEQTRAVVLCIDEKSQVQALDRSQPVLPMRPGQAERWTHD